MSKPLEAANFAMTILISAGISILATLYVVDRRATNGGSKVLVVDTMQMTKYVDQPEVFNAMKEELNTRLDHLATQGYVVLDGSMVLRFPSTAIVSPQETK